MSDHGGGVRERDHRGGVDGLWTVKERESERESEHRGRRGSEREITMMRGDWSSVERSTVATRDHGWSLLSRLFTAGENSESVRVSPSPKRSESMVRVGPPSPRGTTAGPCCQDFSLPGKTPSHSESFRVIPSHWSESDLGHVFVAGAVHGKAGLEPRWPGAPIRVTLPGHPSESEPPLRVKPPRAATPAAARRPAGPAVRAPPRRCGGAHRRQAGRGPGSTWGYLAAAAAVPAAPVRPSPSESPHGPGRIVAACGGPRGAAGGRGQTSADDPRRAGRRWEGGSGAREPPSHGSVARPARVCVLPCTACCRVVRVPPCACRRARAAVRVRPVRPGCTDPAASLPRARGRGVRGRGPAGAVAGGSREEAREGGEG